jgi:hypothetical protein
MAGDLPDYWRIITDLAISLRPKMDVKVLTIPSEMLFSPTQYFDPLLKRLLKMRSYEHHCARMLADCGVSIESLTCDPIRQGESKCYSDVDFSSAAKSLLRHHNPNEKILRRTAMKMIEEAELVDAALSQALREQAAPAFLAIPNGRFPFQYACAEVIRRLDIKAKYYELGLSSSRFYFSDRPQIDYKVDKRDIDREVKLIPSACALAESFMNSRTGLYADSRPPLGQDMRGRTRAVICTSASDETIPTKRVQAGAVTGWSEPMEGYIIAARILSENGYDVVIRQHPNVATKRFSAVAGEVRQLRSLSESVPRAKFLPFNSPVDTYTLVRDAAVVVVWDSTVGIESLAFGIPVIGLSESWWSDGGGAFVAESSADFLRGVESLPSATLSADKQRRRALLTLESAIRECVPFRYTSAVPPYLVDSTGKSRRIRSFVCFVFASHGRFLVQSLSTLILRSRVGQLLIRFA